MIWPYKVNKAQFFIRCFEAGEDVTVLIALRKFIFIFFRREAFPAKKLILPWKAWYTMFIFQF